MRFALYLVASLGIFSFQDLQAQFAIGGGAGLEFPFHHQRTYDPGVEADVFWRKDPYEMRFHFADTGARVYSVLVAMKHFFSQSALRPYFEGAIGPVVIDEENRSLCYGARPELSLGADLGLSKHLSFGAVTRYYGMVYFGDTASGKMEANQGLSFGVQAILWF